VFEACGNSGIAKVLGICQKSRGGNQEYQAQTDSSNCANAQPA
jgi:hypothetical protein